MATPNPRDQVLTPFNFGEHAHVGRQAIYDKRLKVWAYELSYGLAYGTAAPDPDSAMSDVILSTFAELGIERVAFDKLAFIKVTPSVLTGALPVPLPPDRVVLELSCPTISPDDTLVKGMHSRATEGFKIALKDFSYCPEWAKALSASKFVKLNYQALGIAGVKDQLKQLAGHKIETIVENLDRSEDYDACASSGACYFQGHFLMHPQYIMRRRVPRSVTILARVLMALYNPKVSIRDIEELVKLDAGLVAALLRFISTAHFSVRSEVATVRQALSLLGLNELEKWITLLSLVQSSSRPSAILVTSMIRARTCELIALRTNLDSAPRAFSVGLLSTLDALLQMPMDSALAELPISEDLRYAILEKRGSLGRILQAVIKHERKDTSGEAIIEGRVLQQAWIDALSWANEYTNALSA